MEKGAFWQRMIQQFQEEIFQRMSPETRARKLSIMRALSKTMRAKNKENENPLNNNTALPLSLSFKQSTPLKAPQITDLDEVDSESDSDLLLEEECAESNYIQDKNSPLESEKDDSEKPRRAITKIYDARAHIENIEIEAVSESSENDHEDSDETKIKEEKNKHWRSLEVLHENAEHEFCRSLEESKLSVSSASLLEEIEANLPPPYSLTKSFDYTLHTVSSYRTQTRLARMDMHSTGPEFLEEEDGSKMKSTSVKLGYLEVEAMVQKALADQAEKALNLSKNQNFLGVQHLESEKALLLANLRHQAAKEEMKKIKLMGRVPNEEALGEVTISDVIFQVAASAENSKEHYICTATEKENVQSSAIVPGDLDGKIHFKEEFKFNNLEKNFFIVFELYKLKSIEPKKNILKTGLVKKLRRLTPVNTNRSILYSFYGKSSFFRVTSADLRLENVTKRENDKCVLVYRYPEHAIGNMTLRVKTGIKTNFKLNGFLNVFRQTWHRRWYNLSGYYLESWLYPEDRDSGKAPVDVLYLPNCICATSVGIDVCIRPHCFVINSRSPEEKILFSADSNTNMDQWVNYLNVIIENVVAWRPNI